MTSDLALCATPTKSQLQMHIDHYGVIWQEKKQEFANRLIHIFYLGVLGKLCLVNLVIILH